MSGAFDYKEFEQAAPRRDTELTLTATTLLLIVVALVALCGLCFGLGYARGRHVVASETAATVPVTADGSAPVLVAGEQAKPAADTQAETAAVTTAAAAAQLDPDSSNPGATSDSTANATNAQQQVKPALAVVNPVQPGQVAAGTVAPALGQSSQVMVQIASVAQQQDADVLVGALRRRGYVVGAHREPLDGLIHVKVGPFKTAAEAENWRLKLLNDGYNAVVEQ